MEVETREMLLGCWRTGLESSLTSTRRIEGFFSVSFPFTYFICLFVVSESSKDWAERGGRGIRDQVESMILVTEYDSVPVHFKVV